MFFVFSLKIHYKKQTKKTNKVHAAIAENNQHKTDQPTTLHTTGTVSLAPMRQEFKTWAQET